ncbi:MAG: ferredoxin [Candidatus Moranbacteria bacterium]|nr:ferredoxin [Candidatus Moranbacteria bacterium]MBP6034054.1 ferredoxin [Candidatus Moranbacteria bacterium]MBP7696115.1 ferredoxin [Candidatus Moranbacteria bacterium]
MAWKDEARPYGPVKLANGWTVEVESNVCIGAAPCTAIAMKAFALDENGKAAILSTADEDDNDTILNAAKACPVAAIIIKDETGKQIFPE